MLFDQAHRAKGASSHLLTGFMYLPVDVFLHTQPKIQQNLVGNPALFWQIIVPVGLAAVIAGLFVFIRLTQQTAVARSTQLEIEMLERRKAQQNLREINDKFTILAANIPGFIAYVNADTLQYEYVNDAFEKSFGIPRGKIIGSYVKDVIGEKNFQFALKYIDIAKAGKPVSYENTFELVSGRKWIRVNYAPILNDNGQVASIAVLSYDITESKRAEEAIQQKADDLERFNNLMVGRELKMIELKREINKLCEQAGLPARFDLEFSNNTQTTNPDFEQTKK